MDNTTQTYTPNTEFLPICRADMEARGWDELDFVVVGGDAYVDHPSFGTAIISRLLEAEGYRVGVLAQPRYTDCEDFKRFGKPKYGFFIGGGNVDSMVSHYSVAKIPRAEDAASPGGKAGARPDRSATVYTRLAKQAYPGLAGTLRRTGSIAAAVCPLRLLAGYRAAQHRRRTPCRYHQLWYGRAAVPLPLPAAWRQGSRWRASPMWTAPAI